MEPLTSNLRPDRNDYPQNPDGDLGFSRALVVWQYDEIDRLTRREAKLVKALERIAAHPVGQLAMIARAALKEPT